LIPVSVYIITKNCEQTLADTLSSVADFAEIILVDSGSTDKTIEIAQAFNTAVRRFPTNIVAGFGSFDNKPYFEAEKGSEAAPDVKF